MNKPTAILDYTLYVECPECGEETNIVDQDHDYVFADAIFNNKWDALEGAAVQCEHCQLIFSINGVAY